MFVKSIWTLYYKISIEVTALRSFMELFFS